MNSEKRGLSTLSSSLEAIASAEERYSWEQETPHIETLYLTLDGDWLLAEENGSHFPYTTLIPGGMIGVNIYPISEEQAREWMQEHHKLKELSHYFPER